MDTTATTIIHLTDLHIQGPDADPFLGLDTKAKLNAALAFLHDRGLLPGTPVVITGDLVHDGQIASYQRLKPIVDELRAGGTPVYLGLGNHDDRAAFRAVMLDEPNPDPSARYYYRTMLGDVRLLMLDPHVTGTHEGVIDEGQLAWLADELATPAPGGTVLAVHHPPFVSALASMHNLTNGEELRSIIAGTDVCGILAGHQHKLVIAPVASVPCIAAPGTAFLIDAFAQDGYHFQDGATFSIVTVRDRMMEIKPVTLPVAPEVVFWSWEQMREMVRAHAEPATA